MSDFDWYTRCDCDADYLSVDFFVTEEETWGDETYWSIGSFCSHYSLWQRIKIAWLVLRQKEHYFSEVILKTDQMRDLRTYLNGLPLGGETIQGPFLQTTADSAGDFS